MRKPAAGWHMRYWFRRRVREGVALAVFLAGPCGRALAQGAAAAELPREPFHLTMVNLSEIKRVSDADLAVFDEAGICVATVCAGRLVHRRR